MKLGYLEEVFPLEDMVPGTMPHTVVDSPEVVQEVPKTSKESSVMYSYMYSIERLFRNK